MSTIGIATSNPDLFESLRSALVRDDVGFDPKLIEVRQLSTTKEAREWLDSRDRILLVLDCNLPVRLKQPGQDDDDDDDTVEGGHALELIRKMRKSRIDTPVLAIMENLLPDFEAECNPANNAIALPLDRLQNYRGEILTPFLKMLKITPAGKTRTSEPLRVIEVEFFQDRSVCRLGYENSRGLLDWKETKPVRSVRLAANVFSNIDVFKVPGWLDKVRMGGEAVFGQHVVDALGAGLYAHIEAAGGLEALSFRYVITDPALYAAPFEGSLRENSQEGRFVLLHAPVVRSLPARDIVGVSRYPTAILPPSLRMLFIRSQMSEHPGAATDEDELTIRFSAGEMSVKTTLQFAPLGTIDEEQAALEALARELGPARLKIDTLNLSEFQTTGAGKALKARLEAEKYDLIHYAGHAWSSGSSGRETNVLVLPGATVGDAEGFPIEDLAKLAHDADARFVYLSACRGSTTRSLLSFVAHGVPHALGFRCDVDDKRAAAFANSFYGSLVKSGSLCRSFRVACAAARGALKTDDESPIWVTPIMLAQTEDWATSVLAEKIPAVAA